MSISRYLQENIGKGRNGILKKVCQIILRIISYCVLSRFNIIMPIIPIPELLKNCEQSLRNHLKF